MYCGSGSGLDLTIDPDQEKDRQNRRKRGNLYTKCLHDLKEIKTSIFKSYAQPLKT